MAEQEIEPPKVEEQDYYALLQLPRDANEEQIRQSYKRMALTFHPDHHPSNPEEAQNVFLKLKEAHDTLLDPQKRRIYDLYGVSGVATANELSVTQKFPATQELLKAIEKAKIRQEAWEEEGKLKVSGSASVIFGAAHLFQGVIAPPFILAHNFEQSAEIPLAPSLSCTIAGSGNADGSGALSLGLQKNFSKSTLFSTITFVPKNWIFGVGGRRQIGENSAISMNVGIFLGGANFQVSFGHQFSPTASGKATISIGQALSFALEMRQYLEPFETAFTRKLIIGPGGVDLKLSLKRSLNQTNILKTSLRLGLLQLSWKTFSVGMDHMLSPTSQIGFSVSFAAEGFCSLDISYTRGSQKFAFPILLFPKPNLISGSVAVATPFALITGVKYLWQRIRSKVPMLNQQDEELMQKIQKEKLEAESVIQLISREVDRKREIETEKRGLLIVLAKYGNAVEIDKENFESSQVIDVLYPLQYYVNNSVLQMAGGSSKSKFLGFYDPCPGIDKKLYVRYLFQEIQHLHVFQDFDEISLPQRSHQL